MAIPNNQFYTAIDYECLAQRQNEDYRTPFQRDRDRIIHSSALRRLQAKTQVFISGEYDFYRTRLTHSIEVAQIGRSICYFLQQKSPFLGTDCYIDPDLVEAVCLSHDLGHPPFGHSGEETLHRLMKNYGGFEGNAHTLRIITETIYRDGLHRVGMLPTRALIDGVLKYKTLMSEIKNPRRHFIYDSQKQYLDFVFLGNPFPAGLTPGKALNRFRSIECQIMDWSDDTAYSLNDIIDGIQARIITRKSLERWGEDNNLNEEESRLLKGIIHGIMEGDLAQTFSAKIGFFISACSLRERQNFMSNITRRYAYELYIEDEIYKEANFYKRIAGQIVFRSPQLQQLRHKWTHILQKVFFALEENYLTGGRDKLLSDLHHQRIITTADENERMRVLCDHIAGMTDRFLIRTYKRLFDPDFGSIVDLI